MIVDEVVELVAVDDEDLRVAGGEDVLFDDADAQQVGDDIGGAIVIAGDPDDLDFVGEVADLGEDFPVGFFEAAEVDGVEDVAVDDEAAGGEAAIEDVLEEGGDGLGLAVIGAQVKVGDDEGIEAGGAGGVGGWGSRGGRGAG